MDKSAFGVEDSRVENVSKAGMIGPLGTAIKDTSAAPLKKLKPLGDKAKFGAKTVGLNAKTAWQVATPAQKLGAAAAGGGVLGLGLGAKKKSDGS